MDENQVIEEFLDKLFSKKNHLGYFFIVNEVVHPFYLEVEEDFDLISEEEAWNIICDTLLTPSFTFDLKSLLPCFLRGKVTRDRIEIGSLSPFYVTLVKESFRCPEEFSTFENPQYRLQLDVSPVNFTKLRSLNKHLPFLSKLPWKVKSYIASHSPQAEQKIVKKEMLAGRLSIVHARLGALKRDNAIENRPDSQTSKE